MKWNKGMCTAAALLAAVASLTGCGGAGWEGASAVGRDTTDSSVFAGPYDSKSGAPAPKPAPAAPAPKAEAPKAAPVATGNCAGYRPGMKADDVSNRLFFPTGDQNSSALMVWQVMPGAVRVNQPFTYEIHVTNITGGTLQNVALNLSNQNNLNIQSATPAGNAQAGSVLWNLGDMASCQTAVIKVTAIAGKTGTTGNCLTVSYANVLCTATKVVEPALTIAKTITPEAILGCDPITTRLTVKNTGTGEATNVVITDNLPAGLTTTDGKQNISIAVGTLAAGQEKAFDVALRAAQKGTFPNEASVAADGGLKAASNKVQTVVRQPVLAIECKSPERVFIGRDACYSITIKNTGDGLSKGTVVTAAIPAGATVASISDNGQAAGNVITWNAGDLAAGASKTYTFCLKGTSTATLAVTTEAKGTCAAAVSARCTTNVVGIPALLLDGVDDPDPVQVGGNVVYTLKVTNQGSAPLTNVTLTCTMEDSMQFVSADQPGAQVSGMNISFPAIPTLGVGESRTYKITVKALKAGQVQFTGKAKSSEITRELVKTETTNFFE